MSYEERDELAMAWLLARHGGDWRVDDASLNEWEAAYEYVDRREERERAVGSGSAAQPKDAT